MIANSIPNKRIYNSTVTLKYIPQFLEAHSANELTRMLVARFAVYWSIFLARGTNRGGQARSTSPSPLGCRVQASKPTIDRRSDTRYDLLPHPERFVGNSGFWRGDEDDSQIFVYFFLLPLCYI